MKIILLAGMSGSGKSSIAKELCKDDRFNLVYSYTDRPRRDKDDTDHIFVESNYMDLVLERDDIVAKTKIDKYRYCTIESQFDEDKINVYIVDANGINDTFDAFPYADIMTILIRRSEIEADCIRQARDVEIPSRDDVDFLIDNNSKIISAVGTIKTLVGFDLFKKPSHTVETLRSKMEHIDEQFRRLTEIKESLYEQFWYQCRPLYIKMCKTVEEKVNNDFDFDIKIEPDDNPEIYDGELRFHIIGEYTAELSWTDMNELVARMSHYAHTFCKENDCDDIAYHLVITDNWVEADEYE